MGTKDLRNGLEITVSCTEGDTGYIYESALKFTIVIKLALRKFLRLGQKRKS